jgi:hypothetical protein
MASSPWRYGGGGMVPRVSVVAVVLLYGCTKTGQPAVSCGDGTVLNGNECVSVAQTRTDKEIREILIRDSIRSYPGPCPCPYSRNRGGYQCGGTSAYSKPGG